jgi:hypothetical protein
LLNFRGTLAYRPGPGGLPHGNRMGDARDHKRKPATTARSRCSGHSRRWGRVQLLQLAVDDRWSEDAAGSEPRERVPDLSLLRLAQANVSKIMGGVSNWAVERSAAIVEVDVRQRDPAGLEIDHVASCGWMHDSPCSHCSRDL